MHRKGWCKTQNRKIIMATIHISNSIKNATALTEVVEIINGAADGHVEGIEGLEFTPAMLAGQYAQAAAAESGYGSDDECIEAHLDILENEGAKFDSHAALKHGVAIADAKAAKAE